jgi:esterase/lipase superfamily enzyme
MIDSEAMQRPIHVWCYGHFGPPVLVFPSASGMAHEWERQGMIEALSDWLDAGRMKLYCVESNVSEAWTRRENEANWRIQRHQVYEQAVMLDIVPFIREDCETPDIRIALAGTSLGAFFAANFALKHPETFFWALCMSGRYEISEFMDGHSSPDVYFNNPMAYVANLDGEHLDRIRRNTHLVLVCGQGKWEDGNIEETNRLAALLTAKGISNHRDLWGQDTPHEWSSWKRQARYHLGRVFGRV